MSKRKSKPPADANGARITLGEPSPTPASQPPSIDAGIWVGPTIDISAGPVNDVVVLPTDEFGVALNNGLAQVIHDLSEKVDAQLRAEDEARENAVGAAIYRDGVAAIRSPIKNDRLKAARAKAKV